jgi:hypothetical protein
MNDESPNHTGRELELMLAGQKPLAMFYAFVSELPWEELIPDEAFAPHVQAGRVLRQHLDMKYTDSSGRSSDLRYVFYALPSQEWRIQVMTVLKQALYSGAGWNETCERVEGMLLGYTSEECDAHCAQVFRRAAP